MKNICVIIPYSYPVPAILGGAVETLVQFLIDENEKAPSFKFTILATYSKKPRMYKHHISTRSLFITSQENS